MLCEAFGDDATSNVIAFLPVNPFALDDGLLFFGSELVHVSFCEDLLLLHGVDLFLHASDELLLVESFCVMDDWF